ncbi:MAG: hypothetical protein GY841_14945 [FCB group bacterium]|nr:hypothetical protein [FCB group bacterium]
MSRLKHFDNLGTARFITISCFRRLRLLLEDHTKILFLEELAAARNRHKFKLYAYVIMPDHVHLVIYPSSAMSVGPVIGEIKAKSARKILDYFRQINYPMLTQLQVRQKKYPQAGIMDTTMLRSQLPDRQNN